MLSSGAWKGPLPHSRLLSKGEGPGIGLPENTDLEATVSNQTAAIALMENHRKHVREGTARRVVSFNEAVETFMKWSVMEHRDHPNTARRQQVSFDVVKALFVPGAS